MPTNKSQSPGARAHEAELADRLHSAAIHLLRRLRPADESSGLTPSRLSALSVIVFAGPITVTELARAEQVRPPTISRLVKDLETEGLVERRGDEADRRVRRVRATRKGRSLLHRARERRIARLGAALGRLSPGDRETLLSAVEVLERIGRHS